MTEGSEVVIVGGGAAGCAVAYFLSLQGVKATVIEGEGLGTQASGFSSGGLNPLEGNNIPGPLGPLAIESYRMHLGLWDELKDVTGIDYEGRVISLVKVAFDEEGVSALGASHKLFSAAGGDGFYGTLLSREEVLAMEPRISPAIVEGLLAHGNGALDSYKYTLALAAAAEKNGAAVRSGRVRGLRIAGGKVSGVYVGDTEVPCDRLVLAMGPWSREAEQWLDISIPVDPLKGEALRFDMPGDPPVHDFEGGGGSVHPKPDGLVWGGTTEEWKGFDKRLSESARQHITRGAVNLMPAMEEARLALQTACLRPVTPDWMPIVGRAPGWDNVYLTTGAGKKGVLLSPGMGKATADLITRGTTELPIEECSPERFPAVAGRET